jgi:ABC-2 type transport system ATP-binding protein
LFQQKCEQRIEKMMGGGTTVIVVSHSIGQIERLCERVIWLDGGKIRMNDEKGIVCREYKNMEK